MASLTLTLPAGQGGQSLKRLAHAFDQFAAITADNASGVTVVLDNVPSHGNPQPITGANATDVITMAGPAGTLCPYAEGQPVTFPALTGGTGLTAATVVYYVVQVTPGGIPIGGAGVSGTFKVSATPGGAPVNFTTDITAGTVAASGVASVTLAGIPNAPAATVA